MLAKLLSRVALVIVLAVLLIFTSFLLAQEPAPPITTNSSAALEFYGAVQTANNLALAINGQVIALSGAQIDTPLTPGMVVRVQAMLLPDGTITAQRVSAIPVGVLPGVVEFSGILEAVFDTSITVSGQIINTGGTAISPQFVIGSPVRLFAVNDAQGVWTLRGIIPADQVPNPLATPDPSLPITTPDVSSVLPVATQELTIGGGNLQPPLTTPEVNDNDDDDDDDHGGSSGGGDDDDNDNDNDDDDD